MMAVTCYFSGQLGNCFFNIAMMVAYCKKYHLSYYVPEVAIACRGGKPTITVPSTAEQPSHPFMYHEPNDRYGSPYYHDIPKMDNLVFEGYYQSPLYFDWCRDHILETFNLPYEIRKGVVSIHVRRGDCIGVDAFPIAPRSYYQNAIAYMQRKGYNDFLVFSDDLSFCYSEFVDVNYPNAKFGFSEGKPEIEDWISMQNCEHNITARSTFSLTAAWMNRNENKIVCVPTVKHRWWNSQNKDLIPKYFTQIDFENHE